MDRILTSTFSEIADSTVDCACGEKHDILTKFIEVGENALLALPNIVSRVLPPYSHILLVVDNNCKEIMRQVEGALYRTNFRVSSYILSPTFVPSIDLLDSITVSEDVSMIIAVGGGSVADVVKLLGTLCARPTFVVASSYSCGFLAPSSMLYRDNFVEIFVSNPPLGIIMDYNILPTKGELVASGFGEIFSRSLAVFDWKISSLITGEKYCFSTASAVIDLISSLLEAVKDTSKTRKDVCNLLADRVIRFSVLTQAMNSSRLLSGGDTQLLHSQSMLSKERNEGKFLYGEGSLIMATIVAKVYKAYLNSKVEKAFMPPPNNNYRAEILEKEFHIPFRYASKKLQPYLDNKILNLYNYKLEEYRTELCSEIDYIYNLLSVAHSIFKRMYDDAGYHLVNLFDRDEIAISLALAPDVREKFTMLTLMKHNGLLDMYI